MIFLNYNFRQSTLDTKNQSLKQPSSSSRGRKILSPGKTPSLYGEHDCASVNMENTARKVQIRFFCSATRFAMASAWHCKTTQGPTRFNGARSHCGKCEAGHGALSANLEDDQLQRICENLEHQTFSRLPEAQQNYLQKKFDLSEEQERSLDSEEIAARQDCLKSILARLRQTEFRKTFEGASLDFLRNATFENPTASNRVDCFLEQNLRPLEKKLADQCSDLDPSLSISEKEALKTLHSAYQDLLDTLQISLENDLDLLKTLQDDRSHLIEAQLAFTKNPSKENLKTYLNAIQNYQKRFDLRFYERKSGLPRFKHLQTKLISTQSRHVLTALMKMENPSTDRVLQILENSKRHLATDQDLSSDFQEAMEEVQKRLDEVKAQKTVASLDFDVIWGFVKQTLFSENAKGEIPPTPTKDEIARHLCAYIKTVTPTRSDLRIKRKKNLSSPYQTPSAKRKAPTFSKKALPLSFGECQRSAL